MAIRSRYETDRIQRFLGLLNPSAGTRTYFGGYSGWVEPAPTK